MNTRVFSEFYESLTNYQNRGRFGDPPSFCSGCESEGGLVGSPSNFALGFQINSTKGAPADRKEGT